MRKLDSYEDQMKGVVTYELDDDRRVRLSRLAVEDAGGPRPILKAMGVELPETGARVGVMWHGERVGSVPFDFDPDFIRSRSFMYDPRHGDFVRDGKVWVAARTLGLGDLECVVGFRPD